MAAAAAPVVAVLARAPSSGGKSRLFSELGRPPDATFIEALLLDTLDGCIGHGWSCVVAVEPPDACDELVAVIPPSVAAVPQPGGTLGERMRDTMATLLARGASAVVLVGSDLPAMTQERIAQACAVLAERPDALVLGPAADGGYYLLAATRIPEVFAGIRWGSEMVLRQTIAAARQAGLEVHLLEPLEDVDTLSDLRRLCRAGPIGGDASIERGVRTKRWARMHVSGCDGTVSSER